MRSLISPPKPDSPAFGPIRVAAFAFGAGALIAASLTTGCGDEGERDEELAAATCDGKTPYTVPGPYDVGVRTITFDDDPVEIWYPAAKGAAKGATKARYDLRDWMPAEYRDLIPAEIDVGFETDAYRDLEVATNDGPYPVVLFSHGLGGLRLQSSFLTTHLASWGMVVIAPEHVERNMTTVVWGSFEADEAPQKHRDLLANLDTVAADAGLDDMLDAERIAMTGHSQGGATVALVGADPEVDVWLSMASNTLPMSSMDNDISDRPGMVMGGSNDAISGGQEATQYDFLEADDKRLLVIQNAGHMAFTDFCEIADDRGGIFQVALDYEVPIDDAIADLVSSLVRDGCEEGDLPTQRAWPIIRHYATAQLRYGFGIDDSTYLEASTAECFDPDVGTLVHN